MSGSETILLVEDEHQVRAVAEGILERHGYHVLDACDAVQAVLLCSEHAATIDLLLTDVVMPRMSGRELAERIEACGRGRVSCTCRATPSTRVGSRRILEPGISLLQKPITPERLLHQVREVLDAP